jgi:hypothetical protein
MNKYMVFAAKFGATGNSSSATVEAKDSSKAVQAFVDRSSTPFFDKDEWEFTVLPMTKAKKYQFHTTRKLVAAKA